MEKVKNWTKADMTDQTGKTAIVTGANMGIGYETALALYEAGAKVILACRDQKKADEAMAKIKEHAGKGILEALLLDLSSLKSVKGFAEDFLRNHDQLNLLINNAGVCNPPASKTTDGFELQFGTNFIGHYALTGYLYPLLKNTAGSRVVSLSSKAYCHGAAIDFDNLHLEKEYNDMREYSQSKLATTIFGVELQRRIAAAGDHVLSVIAQPGANHTGLARFMDKDIVEAAVKRVGALMEPWQGALPSLYAATSPDVVKGGFYQPDQDSGYRGYPVEEAIEPIALDNTINQKLWQLAEEATGVQFPVR